MRSPTPPETLGYGRQLVDEADRQAVLAALSGERLTQGPAVPRFEEGLVQRTGARHAVAVANGSLALELAYRALDVGAGSRVVTSANTFLATATAALRCGAEVEFVDVERTSGNLDLALLEQRLAKGPPVDVVTPVHFAGLPCDMGRLLELRRRHGFRLVEDAAHALGASYAEGGRTWRVGEHPEVDATILSFHPVKLVTCGEGGAVLTPERERAARLRRLREHGLDRAQAGARPPMVELGLNARLSELHAALGASQLEKLERFLGERRALAGRYRQLLPPGLETLAAGSDTLQHAWHLFVVRLERRDELARLLAARGIATQVHYPPVPRQPWFAQRLAGGDWPVAEEHARRALSLPLFPGMGETAQDRVVVAVHGGLEELGLLAAREAA